MIKINGNTGHDRSCRYDNFINLNKSDNLAYLVGSILGDGSVFISKIGQHRIEFSNTDKSYFDEVVLRLKYIGCCPNGYTSHPFKSSFGKKTVYRLVIESKRFVLFFETLILNDWLDAAELKLAFVRGFYQAEGCLTKPKNTNYYRITISQKKKETLELIEGILKEEGINSKIYLGKDGIHRLYVNKQSDIHNFLLKVSPNTKNFLKQESVI